MFKMEPGSGVKGRSPVSCPGVPAEWAAATGLEASSLGLQGL